MLLSFFFFNDTATTEIYTLSLHDALPISRLGQPGVGELLGAAAARRRRRIRDPRPAPHARSGAALGCCGQGPPLSVHARSEEHTSELQSQSNLVCRLLLEKKKKE